MSFQDDMNSSFSSEGHVGLIFSKIVYPKNEVNVCSCGLWVIPVVILQISI